MNNLDFYTRLPSFSEFGDFTDERHFARVPEDWFVVMTDVKGSTKAVEEGRYKDVNTIGAASISVVVESLQRDLPYVFGGDGATLLVPPDSVDQAMEALIRLKGLARQRFQLELRVGRISVQEVHASGGVIEVAKHELTAGRCTSAFRGGGLALAERILKQRTDEDESPADVEGEIELRGLSCRWNSIPSSRGQIMSLLVVARSGPSAAVYRSFLDQLNEIFHGQLDGANPVHPERMTYKSVATCLRDELRYQTHRFSLGFFRRLGEIFAAVLVFKWRLHFLLFHSRAYLQSLRLHSDYRKFDDTLRMILDCTKEQVDAVHEHLKACHERGALCYGTHLSGQALITCYVQEMNDGGHIHFIDGGDGGYAMAARQLKRQLNEVSG